MTLGCANANEKFAPEPAVAEDLLLVLLPNSGRPLLLLLPLAQLLRQCFLRDALLLHRMLNVRQRYVPKLPNF